MILSVRFPPLSVLFSCGSGALKLCVRAHSYKKFLLDKFKNAVPALFFKHFLFFVFARVILFLPIYIAFHLTGLSLYGIFRMHGSHAAAKGDTSDRTARAGIKGGKT